MTVWSTKLSAFATGTGTAETAEQTVPTPANAVELVGVRQIVDATQGVPAESIIGVGKIKGDNWQDNPYEWFSEISSAKLGAIDQVACYFEPRWWPANIPVIPNADIAYTYEPLDAQAANGKVAVQFLWSDVPSGIPRVHRKCSREIATTTTTNSEITLTDLGRLTNFYWGVSTAAVTADDPGDYSVSITSSALNKQQTFESITYIQTIEATTGVGVTTLMQNPLDISAKQGTTTATFAATLTETTALTAAGQWFYALEYVPIES